MSHETHWKFIENLCLIISKYYLCYCITFLDFISTYTLIMEILYGICRLLGTKMDFRTHKYLFFMPNHLRHFQLIWKILYFVANVVLKFLPTDVPLRFAPPNVLPRTYQRFKKNKMGKKVYVTVQYVQVWVFLKNLSEISTYRRPSDISTCWRSSQSLTYF